MKLFKEQGGRFYLIALCLAGPCVWAMSLIAVAEAFGWGEGIDYEGLGFGISAIIGSVAWRSFSRLLPSSFRSRRTVPTRASRE